MIFVLMCHVLRKNFKPCFGFVLIFTMVLLALLAYMKLQCCLLFISFSLFLCVFISFLQCYKMSIICATAMKVLSKLQPPLVFDYSTHNVCHKTQLIKSGIINTDLTLVFMTWLVIRM